jgi:hypothetical protein
MHLAGNFDVGRLDVHLVPVSDVQAEDKITVSRISIYRTGN